MVIHVPSKIKEVARELRKNMTESEKILWRKVRDNKLGERVLRQKPFYVYTENSGLDRFIIPDFYIASKKLIIEIDGYIHELSNVLELDKIKDELILQRGFNIIRITNEEIKNDLENVIKKLKQQIK